MRAYERKRETTPQPGWVHRKPTDGRPARRRRPGSAVGGVEPPTGAAAADGGGPAARLAAARGTGGHTDGASSRRSTPQPPRRAAVGLGGGEPDGEPGGTSGDGCGLPPDGNVTTEQVPTSDAGTHDGGHRVASPGIASVGRMPSGDAGALRAAGLNALTVWRGPRRSRRGGDCGRAAAPRAPTDGGGGGSGGRAPAVMEAASAAAAADMAGAAGATGSDDGRPARRATVPPDRGVVGDRTRPRRREAVSMAWGDKDKVRRTEDAHRSVVGEEGSDGGREQMGTRAAASLQSLSGNGCARERARSVPTPVGAMLYTLADGRAAGAQNSPPTPRNRPSLPSRRPKLGPWRRDPWRTRRPERRLAL